MPKKTRFILPTLYIQDVTRQMQSPGVHQRFGRFRLFCRMPLPLEPQLPWRTNVFRRLSAGRMCVEW